MQAVLAGTGVLLSDGPTVLLPVALRRVAPDAPPLTRAQEEESRRAVHRAWKAHYDHVRASLRQGFYPGWDLHPAQLPTRYAAVYAFYLEAHEEVAARLRSFVERATQAALVGNVFDDAATGQGLLNFFRRGLSCGALAPEEAHASGLTPEELSARSLARILKARRARAGP